MTTKALDAALARIPRHRGVTLRTGLDTTLSRTSRKSNDQVTIRDASEVKIGEWLVRREGYYWIVTSENKSVAPLKFPAGSGDNPADAVRYAKRKLGLDAALAAVPDHAPLGDRLRRRLGLTGLDATLAGIPDRRVKDASALYKKGESVNVGGDKGTVMEVIERDTGFAYKLKMTSGSESGKTLTVREEGVRDSESDIVACYKKHLAGGSSRSEAIAETATEMHVPERDVRELVGATGDHWISTGKIEKYEIFEGAGTDGGSWMAKGRGEVKRFKTRREAEEHAEQSSVGDSALDRALRAIPDRRGARDADEDFKVGEKVHLGFGAKGGAGFYGVVTKVEGETVEIKHENGKTYTGQKRFTSR
jgi:hypothetical protein